MWTRWCSGDLHACTSLDNNFGGVHESARLAWDRGSAWTGQFSPLRPRILVPIIEEPVEAEFVLFAGCRQIRSFHQLPEKRLLELNCLIQCQRITVSILRAYQKLPYAPASSRLHDFAVPEFTRMSTACGNASTALPDRPCPPLWRCNDILYASIGPRVRRCLDDRKSNAEGDIRLFCHAKSMHRGILKREQVLRYEWPTVGPVIVKL